MLFYVGTSEGTCAIISSKSKPKSSRFVEVREAEQEDINWVKGMGGYVPKEKSGQ
ncbi:MAG: hypothetical protein ACEQSC_01775 [Candidatus Nanopelagicaceae bacterium]